MRRLDQILSSLGYCSRRQAAYLIKAGRVTVEGRTASRPDDRADPHLVCLDGEPLEAPDGLLVLLHKPLGYVCTHSTAEGPTVYDLLPPRWLVRNPSITSIGRLDKDSSGLLLLTDKGSLVHRFSSPRAKCEKVYLAEVDADLSPNLVEIFASGQILLRSEEKPCLPARLEILDPRHARLTLTEGRYHQVRRMFASQGLHVTSLHRERFGPFHIGQLSPGDWELADPSPYVISSSTGQ